MTPIFVAHIEAKLTLFHKESGYAGRHILTGFPPAGENDGLGGQW
ncbi:hypothetical protein [Candidatus Spongiihabitans sp.]